MLRINPFFLGLFVLGTTVLFADQFEPQKIDRTFDVSGRTHLVIKNEDGRTSVKAASGSQVIVHATKEVVGARSEREYEHTINKVDVEIEQSGNEVRAIVHYPKWHFGIHFGTEPHVIVNFDITAPVETDLTADVSDGPLEASGFDGAAHLHASDGDITADHLKGNLQISASDGTINATALSGEMEVSASDGHIVAEDCAGKMSLHTSDGNAKLVRFNGALEARTADGKLWVDGILNSLAAKTSDGSMQIRVAPESVMEGDWSIRFADGDVELQVPPSFSADVDMQTSDGHINTQVPIAMSGSLSRSHLTGKLNAGGHLLQIHTSDGDISINGSDLR